VARIASIVGPDRVGAPAAVDSHAPEELAVAPYEPPPPPEMKKKPRKGRGLLAVRVLRPPVALEVMTNGKDLVSIASESIKGRVRVASGPWRLEDGWWRDAPVARDYWDVEVVSGGIYRVFREQMSGNWFADGIYD